MSNKVQIEMLESGGWQAVGEYRSDRAVKMCGMLRAEGFIVRTDGELPIRSRASWSCEEKSGAWLGSIDGMVMFILTPVRVNDFMRPSPRTSWALHVLLPGYQNTEYNVATQLDGEEAAERVLDRWMWRIGARPVYQDELPGQETLELTILDFED